MVHASSTLPMGIKHSTQVDSGTLRNLDSYKLAYDTANTPDTNSRVVLKDIPPPDESKSHVAEMPELIPPPSDFVPEKAIGVLPVVPPPPFVPPVFGSIPPVTTASEHTVPPNYIFINNINEFSALPTSFRTSNFVSPGNQYQSITETFYDPSVTVPKNSISKNVNTRQSHEDVSKIDLAKENNILEQTESFDTKNSLSNSGAQNLQVGMSDLPPPLPDHAPPPLYSVPSSSISDIPSVTKIRTLSTDLYLSSEEVRIKPPIRPKLPPKPSVSQTNMHAEGTGSGLRKGNISSGAYSPFQQVI